MKTLYDKWREGENVIGKYIEDIDTGEYRGRIVGIRLTKEHVYAVYVRNNHSCGLLNEVMMKSQRIIELTLERQLSLDFNL